MLYKASSLYIFDKNIYTKILLDTLSVKTQLNTVLFPIQSMISPNPASVLYIIA